MYVSSTSAQDQTLTYDGLNRLTSDSWEEPFYSQDSNSGINPDVIGSLLETNLDQTFNLDALGNTTSTVTGGFPGSTSTVSRTNNDQNQVQTVTTPTTGGGTTTATLAYDANGNTTQDQNGQQYVYDAWNRLVTVKNSAGATIASYAYDAQGRQIRITESGVTTDLYYSNRWQVIEEQQSGVTTTQYVWSPFYVDQMVERDDTDVVPPAVEGSGGGSIF